MNVLNPIAQPSLSMLAIRDLVLTELLQERLRNDRRTAHLQLGICVDGGVAHVDGEVNSEVERQLVRGLLRQQAGLHGVWDLLTLPGQRLNVADLGCGGAKQKSYAIGVDAYPHPGVDVVANLEEKLPFDSEYFDNIFVIHVLEHIQDLLGVMREIHRILKPEGVLHVMVPYWKHENAIADPTHCRFMDAQTFKYFCNAAPGVLPWRPLMVTASEDTVFADLQPIKTGFPPDREECALWFK